MEVHKEGTPEGVARRLSQIFGVYRARIKDGGGGSEAPVWRYNGTSEAPGGLVYRTSVRVPPLGGVIVEHTGVSRREIANALGDLLPCSPQQLSMLVDGREAKIVGQLDDARELVLVPSAEYLAAQQLMPSFHSWNVTGLNSDEFRSMEVGKKRSNLAAMLTKGVVALQEHRLSEVQLRPLEAGTRGAEIRGIPAVQGPHGKPGHNGPAKNASAWLRAFA